jgi:hypothetical protein
MVSMVGRGISRGVLGEEKRVILSKLYFQSLFRILGFVLRSLYETLFAPRLTINCVCY